LAKRGEIGSLAKRGDILQFPDDFSDIFSRHSSSQLGGSESANHRNAPRTDAEGFVHPIAHPRSLPVFPPPSDLQWAPSEICNFKICLNIAFCAAPTQLRIF
jgi:hypothetical protein